MADKAVTNVNLGDGKYFAPGQEVTGLSNEDRERLTAAGAIMQDDSGPSRPANAGPGSTATDPEGKGTGEPDQKFGAAQTTVGGANPATGETAVGPNRIDTPAGQVEGKRDERPVETANAGNVAASGAGQKSPTAEGQGGGTVGTASGNVEPKVFAYGDASVDEVEAEYTRRGLNAKPTGSGGRLLKADMIGALEADDKSRQG